VIVSPADVVDAIRRAGGSVVPDTYYLCTAARESGFDTSAVGDGGTSIGIYQSRTGSFDLDDATRDMINITERNRLEIRAAAGVSGEDPWDMGAYLSVAHNQGLGAALMTIAEYGMDWSAYAARNGDVVKPGFDGPRIVARGWACCYGARGGAGALIGGLAGVAIAAGITYWGARG
jgi:hypothetical protein